ncbi:hypothetical protein EYF80_033358 [Liparis tanakae]|uniref:Uncharacterized protein n=1 Tax=Liparis tanakae TaxID=230148 RepID=A0A4Z2GRW4_9TELE|nr:hypothetical protein EYF80_033358 [Liparis tanakae]
MSSCTEICQTHLSEVFRLRFEVKTQLDVMLVSRSRGAFGVKPDDSVSRCDEADVDASLYVRIWGVVSG